MLINFKDHFKNKIIFILIKPWLTEVWMQARLRGLNFQQKDMDWSIKIKHGEKSVLVIEL